MSPRPSEEARRALRAARERREAASAETGESVGAPASPMPEASADAPPRSASEHLPDDAAEGFGSDRRAEPRPGDAARAALRRAISARRTGTPRDAGADAPTGTPQDADAPTEGTGVPAGVPAEPADSSAQDAGVPAEDADTGAPTPHPGTSDDPDVPTQESPPSRPRSEPAPDATSRPGDSAREALRAARRARPDAPAQRTGRGRRPTRPAPTAARPEGPAARAAAVRDLLAGAFRLPADEDPADEDLPDETRTEQPTRPRPTPAKPHHAPEPVPAPTPPSRPTTPRSMAAPDRDGELRRTFPAFPAGPSAGEGFADTWWGNAWVEALEEGALDAKRLARGRGYAERGHVDAITVTPGLVLAYVQGSRARPYRVQVRLRTLDDSDWERFLDAAAERPGHIAALLDKELPHSLADCGVPLLPGPGDLAPQCSCPDSGHPCKHAAALCYQTARLLDADPFVLLLLRGRGERDLLDALSRLSATRAARAAQDRDPGALPGVRAAEALAPRTLPPLPPPLPAPPHPEQPPAYPAAPGGPDPLALDQLATDAAARAHALLTTGRDPVGGLTLWQDAVRLAAARPGSGLTAGTRALYSSLAGAAGRSPAELARAVAAWRQGGPEGLSVLEEPWDPPAGRFDRARPLLLAADLPAFRPWRNRLTHPRGHVQLRLGRDGLWYAYESEPGRDDWWPRGTPDLDPVGALTGLGAPTEE
ncbi:SWIM zinc finger family protein [Streptomyces fumanus]|uniref:SWIM zinc finger family protein n=1 Tax=Streptomyces fumanus TaxID=67302 RepID=UPI0033DAEEA0